MKEEHRIIRRSGERRIIIANSIATIDESNRNDVVITGSHCGINVGEYASNLGVRGVIGNDAGKGRDNAGIAGLEILERHGIPGAAVSTMSARIGNGMSTYEEGIISAANEVARGLGIAIGMSAREAADKIFER
ncbi:MAG TPA: hypothetical protein G4O03_08590 [Dehalococcoidia bacterium]|jgi:hypothetical protein|nr:hypothetical protein [Dehalococcoidia bacterium]